MSTYYVSDTIQALGDGVVNQRGKGPCLHGISIIVGTQHCEAKIPHVLKFSIFTIMNSLMPVHLYHVVCFFDYNWKSLICWYK